MGGVDKGLQTWRHQPLARWVVEVLLPQVHGVGISANRNLQDHEQLLRDACQAVSSLGNLGVRPDDADLPARSGPLAGILTGLRHSPTDWLQFAACDTPRLPPNLVAQLASAVQATGADIAVPCTEEVNASGNLETRPHWTCAPSPKGVTPELVAAFVKGDRKVGQWIQSQRWVAVSFAPASDFENMNTLETLDGRA